MVNYDCYVLSKILRTACISFDMFMRWWSELHNSSADPDQCPANGFTDWG